MAQLSFPVCSDIARAAGVYEELRRTRPQTRRDLKNYVKVFLGIDVPDKRICPEHQSPMDYLWHTFRESKHEPRAANHDSVVWANRAGGKTELAAVATLLDCLFKPDCQVRILGGSGEQAGRMYEYLTGFLRNGYEQFLAGPVRKNKCHFVNGSAVEVLTQSPPASAASTFRSSAVMSWSFSTRTFSPPQSSQRRARRELSPAWS